MEIDLNHAVSDPEEKKCIDGNCGCGCCSTTSTSTCSSNASSPSSASAPLICKELWHACAGPLISLPKKGNAVVYFPQGHLEQTFSASPLPPMEINTFGVPPHVFCRIVDVQLLANKENDEVFTKLTLLPQQEVMAIGRVDDAGDEEGNGVLPSKPTSHMFCKTLTASDTSAHGGFSVPRRAAEDCFPPLDYNEPRPSQEIIAKDLHGVEWKFRHIYRGQPRRHLLTTGWSIFVGQKNLISGDAVLFLRGEGGDLRLGIRRAVRPRNSLPDSITKTHSSYANLLSPVADALSNKSPFSVFYIPRGSHPDFIIPYQKYVKSTATPVPVGTTLKLRFDFDDSPERSGMVTGISDMDPYRWPNSNWNCLVVRWDDDVLGNHHDRVSPWQISFSAKCTPLSFESSPTSRHKKLRSLPVDFDESIRSYEVLQGQENSGLVPVTPLHANNPRSFNHIPNMMDRNEFLSNQAPPTTFTGFLESNWFLRVLQGQEICSLRSLTRKRDLKHGPWSKPELGYGLYGSNHGPQTSFYPLASEGIRNVAISQKGVIAMEQGPLTTSTIFSAHPVSHNSLVDPSKVAEIDRVVSFPDQQRAVEKQSVPNNKRDDDSDNENPLRCKIFGFSLTGGLETRIPHSSSKRRCCTKVHKQGSLVGRAIDLSKLNSYDDLLLELEKLFTMEEGLLRDPNHGWCVLYTDNDNDMMVVGDDPWPEFVEVATKLHIYTQEEVEKLSIIANSDDTKSCLEEAPPVVEASKSSSIGQLDSSSSALVST